MFVKKIGALLPVLLLFSASNANAQRSKMFTVGCKVEFKVKPVCEAQGILSYNPINFNDNNYHSKPSSSWHTIEILGIGDSFAEAWDDVHRVCKKRACHVTSCTLKEVYAKKEVYASFSKTELGCRCSYKIGNTCGGKFGDTGKEGLQGNISQILEQADQICKQGIKKMPNVPAQAVAFAHDCSGLGNLSTTIEVVWKSQSSY